MKKVQNHTIYGNRNIREFLANHIGETIRVKKVFDNAMVFAVEHDKSTPEIHMEVLNHLASYGTDYSLYLSGEEIAALEYAIECIKTLEYMGAIK